MGVSDELGWTRVFHLVAGAFAMTDIMHRAWFMVTDGARPIDWIIVFVDFLVLVAILIFELPEWGTNVRHAVF